MICEAGGKLGQLFPPESEQHLSLVLFDEIEKAHPKMWNLLLGILEDGHLVLGNNEEVAFSRAVIVLTTNVGSDVMGAQLDHNTIGFDPGVDNAQLNRNLEESAKRAAQKVFPQEFLNRFDDLITFQTLERPHLFQILDNLIAQIHHRSLRCAEPFLLEVTQQAKERLVEMGTDAKFGARPLKRVVEKHLVTPISHYICSDQVKKGDLITVDLCDGAFAFLRETGVTSWEELESLGPFPPAKWARADLGVKDDGGEKKEIVEPAAQAVLAGALTGAGVPD
jgi:ATP-dependent Clp protease ATP-binding subunit ClpC